ECERHRAVGRGDRCEEVAGSRDHRLLHGAGGGERVQRHLDVDREAERAALVGLEAVAEAAVVVLVGAQRVDHAVGRCALEDRGEEALFEDASLPADEVAGGGERIVHLSARIRSYVLWMLWETVNRIGWARATTRSPAPGSRRLPA